MSQFMLIERELKSPDHPLVVQRELHEVGHQELHREVATQNFGDWRNCRLVTDADGVGEPLIDAMWTARVNGTSVEETAIARFFKEAVTARVRFVIWCSSDFFNLPVAHDWLDVMEQFKSQTRDQPAEVHLSFVPISV